MFINFLTTLLLNLEKSANSIKYCTIYLCWFYLLQKHCFEMKYIVCLYIWSHYVNSHYLIQTRTQWFSCLPFSLSQEYINQVSFGKSQLVSSPRFFLDSKVSELCAENFSSSSEIEYSIFFWSLAKMGFYPLYFQLNIC